MTAVDVDALDKLREALAEAVRERLPRGMYNPAFETDADDIADALLPVVDRIASERAAAELEAAIVEISRDRDNCPNKVRRQGYGGALYVLKCRHAVALREPTS